MKNGLHCLQRGVTLVIATIILVLMSLFIIAAINMTSVNFRIMGNEQVRNEAIAAGQQAIEQVVSTNFPANPQPQTVNVDINGDGTTDYTVSVAKPVCQNSVPVKLTQLNIAAAADLPCFGSATSPLGASGNSLCSSTQWDIAASVVDTNNNGATATIHQGVGERVPIGTTC